MNKLPLLLITCFLLSELELNKYRSLLINKKISYEEYLDLTNDRINLIKMKND